MKKKKKKSPQNSTTPFLYSLYSLGFAIFANTFWFLWVLCFVIHNIRRRRRGCGKGFAFEWLYAYIYRNIYKGIQISRT